uniref:Uncharacterized protein n=1 Tax=Rhizophora mucronata TaxID=61149 RepID=A0A2P2MYZ4_RHIMU
MLVIVYCFCEFKNKINKIKKRGVSRRCS